jgi:SNF2 family DNA or RNA helicase
MRVTADIDPDFPEKITLPNVPFQLKELCNTVPGLLYDKKLNNGTWRMPLSWTGCLALRGTFKQNLDVGPALSEWAANEKATRIDPCMALRDALDADGMEGLYPFQKAGVAFMKNAKRALCCDDMGTGKTRQAIATLLAHYMDGTDPFPALVICPNSMKHTWKREIEAVWPGIVATVVDGSITKRRKQLAEPAHVKIMNWEAVRHHSRLQKYGSVALKKCVECGGMDSKIKESACHVHEKELNRMDFKAVIVDEAHRMVDGKSQQTRAIKAATGDADIRIALTGTPIANSPDELWSILNWLSPEEWPSKSRYIDRLINVSFDMWGVRSYTGIKPEMREEFFAAVNPRMRRMPKELVLKDLPPLVYERRDIPMETSTLTRALRMLQFASSYAETEVENVIDPETGEMKQKVNVFLKAPSNKVDAFMEDLPDFGESQVVVFAASRQLIELLSDKMTKKNIDHGLITGAIPLDEREHYMNTFQDGDLKYILCTTGAGGTGITLTAADTAVYLQRPWSMIESEQSEARVRRIGSEKHESITIIDYVSSGTIDETVIQAIETKSNRLQEILQDQALLKRILEMGDE